MTVPAQCSRTPKTLAPKFPKSVWFSDSDCSQVKEGRKNLTARQFKVCSAHAQGEFTEF